MRNKFMAMIFVIGFIGGLFLGSYTPEKTYNYKEIVVNPGDTLWDLTIQNSNGNYNIQELVYRTSKENGIKSGNLFPGQKIKLCVGVAE